MRLFKHSLFIYIVIVIVPTLILSSLYTNYKIKDDYAQRKKQTDWTASVHQKSWDQFISEILSSLKIISMVVQERKDSPKENEVLLQQVNVQDPRTSGIYLLNRDGSIAASSNKMLQKNYFLNKPYIRNVVATKDIIVADEQETIENGQKIIGIAVPVLDKQRHLLFVLVAHLRVDYIENVMKVLTPEAKLVLLNSKNKPIMSLNVEKNDRVTEKDWTNHPIERLPWSFKIKMPEANTFTIVSNSIAFAAFLLILFHIAYLLMKYNLLKRQSAQEKIQNEAQKLELVGSLAASTAHEIRNPLTGIKGLVQLLSEKYQNPEDQFYFQIINEEINRINEIASEFLILGKPTVLKTERIDLRKILHDIEPFIKSEANLIQIQYEYLLAPEPIYIECTKDQIKQVILNITKNAFESMERAGKLTVKLDHDAKHGILEISDTGHGIAEAELNKIFDPFYTSKDNGTGLGLAVCKRIIHSFNGNITIHSQVGKGTTVIITLPISKH